VEHACNIKIYVVPHRKAQPHQKHLPFNTYRETVPGYHGNDMKPIEIFLLKTQFFTLKQMDVQRLNQLLVCSRVYI
jgi:hypothetical protein